MTKTKGVPKEGAKRKPERPGASTKRTKAAKERMHAAGLVRVEVWVYPDQKEAVKDYAALVSVSHNGYKLEDKMSCGHLANCSRCAAEVAEAEFNIDSLAAANTALRDIGEYLHNDAPNEKQRKYALERYFALYDMLNYSA